jgi:hypothetical protein
MTETDFQVLGFFPADHAAAVEAKVYVNGGYWNMLRFPAFPHVMPSFSLVAVLKVPYRAYHQDHRIRILLEDADGKPLNLDIEGSFRVGTEPHMRMGDPTVLPVAINVNNLAFEQPGDFVFKLAVDGTDMARYEVRVVQFVGGMVAAEAVGGGEAAPPAEE